MSEEITYFSLTESDIPETAQVEAECFADSWSEESIRSTMRGPASFGVGCRVNGELAGCCFTQVILDEGEILRIGVREPFLRRGIATGILETLFACKPMVETWFLDVRESNLPARGLYEKEGFRVIGKRENYYHQPTEDAILMERGIISTEG